MKIKDKIMMDKDGLTEHGPINVVIFGDSVSHGALNGTIDYENVYWNLLKRKLNHYRDYVPVNMINASIGGTTAQRSVARIDKQVLCHCPDLVIVCFGLNDVNKELSEYIGSLGEIFDKLLSSGCEVIFMTPNMLNTYVEEDTSPDYLEYAAKTAQMQTGGRMDTYMEAACALARDKGVSVCDCYSRWKELSKTTDTTLLLANRINHPISEMHTLFADMLYDMIMNEAHEQIKSDSTMYE